MTTYYVDGAVGNDANAGTAEGAGNAWATGDHAMNNVIAGDLVYLKDTGDYVERLTIDTLGSLTAPITFEGYTTTPGDNGKITIDGDAACLVGGSANAAYIFRNIIFTGSTGNGVSAATTAYLTFQNCEFINNSTNGATVSADCVFINCVAYGNGQRGITLGSGCVIGCVLYSNSQEQAYTNNVKLFYKNVAYAPTATYAVMHCQDGPVIGNTVDGDNTSTVTGLQSGSAIRCYTIDNIVYDCDTGIGKSGAPRWPSTWVGHNLLNSNNTDYDTALTGYNSGYGDVTGAPAFTNEAGDDYTLSETSAAIGSGVTPGGIT